MIGEKRLGSIVLTKTNNQTAYNSILEHLKTEFDSRWDKKTHSNSNGLDNFNTIKTLSIGNFGRVYLVEIVNEAFFAMKCFSKRKIVEKNVIQHILTEKRILQAVRFPFIINLKYCYKDNSFIYFLMPFINGGEMFTHLRKMERFPEKLSIFYAAQILLALEYLHFCDVIHRDLKPENILISYNGYVKLVDLGFSKMVKNRTYTLCGTPEYVAPEIILSKGYGKAVDWWSFGVLIYEMNAGFAPFESADPLTLFSKIIACRYKFPHRFSYDLRNLIQNTIQVDLSRRFGNLKNGTQDLKNHNWFNAIDFMAIYHQQVDPPFTPDVRTEGDTRYFDEFEEEIPRVSMHDEFKKEFEEF